ncbi:hypothetical protein IF2G_05581 [Cordyceps javanica]|nr:hypothetical protein IF2G_05581 [Cordyceps javanica]
MRVPSFVSWRRLTRRQSTGRLWRSTILSASFPAETSPQVNSASRNRNSKHCEHDEGCILPGQRHGAVGLDGNEFDEGCRYRQPGVPWTNN